MHMKFNQLSSYNKEFGIKNWKKKETKNQKQNETEKELDDCAQTIPDVHQLKNGGQQI